MTINAGPEIPKSEFIKSGVDSGDLEDQLRAKVATSANLSISEVTPLDQVAENGLNSFFENVVHTETESQPQPVDQGESTFDQAKEDLFAHLGSGEGKIRVADSKTGFYLVTERVKAA